MKYYKVLSRYDNKPKNPKIHDGNIYIANELYTPQEVEEQQLNVAYMEPVDIPETHVYWFFGARFEARFEAERGTGI